MGKVDFKLAISIGVFCLKYQNDFCFYVFGGLAGYLCQRGPACECLATRAGWELARD